MPCSRYSTILRRPRKGAGGHRLAGLAFTKKEHAAVSRILDDVKNSRTRLWWSTPGASIRRPIPRKTCGSCREFAGRNRRRIGFSAGTEPGGLADRKLSSPPAQGRVCQPRPSGDDAGAVRPPRGASGRLCAAARAADASGVLGPHGAIPARVAGVEKVVMVTPPTADGG